ncbi:MAG: biotin--[acetyl-CoA-carboxylase] ligase [Bacteroidota bacterium]|nr:biotin--[acetyl-CoA-carboxylase] ligase [Bacteroidota bacterium]
MIGTHLIQLGEIDSTNRYARDLLATAPPEGTVVTALVQTAGRGRLDRRWQSADGENLLASVILYPTRPMEEWGGLPLLAGLAAARVIRAMAGIDAVVKWPNDVLVRNHKLCGVLVESGRIGANAWAVVGIGINVNQQEFPGEYRLAPTSMAREAGHGFGVDDVRAALCGEMDALYVRWRAEGTAPILAAWKEAARMFGRMIVIDDGDNRRTARARDLGPDGSLLVEDAEGRVESVYAGDVSVRDQEEIP